MHLIKLGQNLYTHYVISLYIKSFCYFVYALIFIDNKANIYIKKMF